METEYENDNERESAIAAMTGLLAGNPKMIPAAVAKQALACAKALEEALLQSARKRYWDLENLKKKRHEEMRAEGRKRQEEFAAKTAMEERGPF
jgi:formylmethanofuran dehydrogenase subunit E